MAQTVPKPDGAFYALDEGALFKKMRLFIRRVRCVEETHEIGNDEINMGGTFTDPYGNTNLVKEFEVSDDFDAGQLVDFGMSKAFCTWNLATAKEGFPYVYAATVILVEKDDGGFFKLLVDLWKNVKTAVVGAISTATGLVVAAAIQPALVAVIGAVIERFIAWIKSLFDNPDDIIDTQPWLMTLAAATRSYYDYWKFTSPEGYARTLTFRGAGGKYLVDCSYRVFTQ